jgi:intracellular sulfur oxidation DsrE/DsrF family protein
MGNSLNNHKLTRGRLDYEDWRARARTFTACSVGAGNIDLKVVLHGDGLSLLLYPDALKETKMKEANATDEMQARIAGLKQQGVQFDVCANTLSQGRGPVQRG